MTDHEFSLNVNKIAGEVKVVSEPVRTDDADIYDLRRQIEARQVVKDYVRAEIGRLQKLLEDMTHDIIRLDMALKDRKPVGEPRNLRHLYAPGTEGNVTLNPGEGAIEGEVVE